MNIIYAAGVCSKEKFLDLTEKKIIRKLPQAQKYHRLFIEGLRKNLKDDILVLSSFPVNRSWCKKVIFPNEAEFNNRVTYNYLMFLNIPFLRQLLLFLGSFVKSMRFLAKKKKAIGICDILTAANSTGLRLACKLHKRKCLAIVTDVPSLTSGARMKTLPKSTQFIKKILEKVKSKNLDVYDGYIMLSKYMNSVVNKYKKPYIVLEGHCDILMDEYENTLSGKLEPKALVYTGGIHKEFGIERFVKAFISLDNPQWELHIYGNGNFQNELTNLCEKHHNVKYYGTVSNDVAVKAQITASLLANPRLTDAEYVKYSFPSKNLEYMASGTPVMTTILPAMPKDYYDYVYLIEDESQKGFETAMKKVFNMSKEQRHKKGKDAKQFVLEKKNNFVQAKRAIDFIKDNF